LNESGRLEVYVTPIPGPGPRLQVSVDGGSEPVWARVGNRLFYRVGLAPADMMTMSAGIAETPTLTVGKRNALFADKYVRFGVHTIYDVFLDGRFAFVRTLAPQAPARLTVHVIMNWAQGLDGTGVSALGRR